MEHNLLIVESPNKIHTLGTFLNDKWEVIATVGHIRDLKKINGYDEKTLEPNWVISSSVKQNKNSNVKSHYEDAIIDGTKFKELHISFFNRKNKTNEETVIKSNAQRVAEINSAAHKATNIYLAADPDREGEAIAWHVYEVLNDEDKKKCKRITFHEITEEAVLEAIKNPRKININEVHSQFARRILDRMIGFGLSKVVREKFHAQSAGRVQSVALKFINDREKEIKAFTSNKWFIIKPLLENMNYPIILRDIDDDIKNLNLYYLDANKEEVKDKKDSVEIGFRDEESAKKVIDKLKKEYEIYQIDKPRIINTSPAVPFKTSSMQQAAINVLGMNIGKATSVAQKLYEGINIKGKHTALISYPRTDSIRLADSFVAKVKKYIEKTYGENEFVHREFVSKADSSKNVQDAHEGIRVIDPFIFPSDLKNKIPSDEYRLYKLIWMRSIAAFMSPCKSESITIRLKNEGCKFYTHSSKIISPGYRKIWDFENEKISESIDFSKYQIGDKLKIKEITSAEVQHAPPPRFNQASLVRELEDKGVGRPSTYNSMAQLPIIRGYAFLDKKTYIVSPLGNEVADGLDAYFSDLINVEFTKQMEENLDEISHNSENWKDYIFAFQPKFKKLIDNAEKNMPKAGPQYALDEKGEVRLCPKCKSPLIVRFSPKSHANFVACSAYPLCDYVEFPKSDHRPQEIIDEKCPLCGKPLAKRWSKRGEFIGCTGYPSCHYARPANMTNAEFQASLLNKKNNTKQQKETKPKNEEGTKDTKKSKPKPTKDKKKAK